MPQPETVTLPNEALVAETLERQHRAERVLIGAGAGLSVDAGIDKATSVQARGLEFVEALHAMR